MMNKSIVSVAAIWILLLRLFSFWRNLQTSQFIQLIQKLLMMKSCHNVFCFALLCLICSIDRNEFCRIIDLSYSKHSVFHFLSRAYSAQDLQHLKSLSMCNIASVSSFFASNTATLMISSLTTISFSETVIQDRMCRDLYDWYVINASTYKNILASDIFSDRKSRNQNFSLFEDFQVVLLWSSLLKRFKSWIVMILRYEQNQSNNAISADDLQVRQRYSMKIFQDWSIISSMNESYSIFASLKSWTHFRKSRERVWDIRSAKSTVFLSVTLIITKECIEGRLSQRRRKNSEWL